MRFIGIDLLEASDIMFIAGGGGIMRSAPVDSPRAFTAGSQSVLDVSNATKKLWLLAALHTDIVKLSGLGQVSPCIIIFQFVSN